MRNQLLVACVVGVGVVAVAGPARSRDGDSPGFRHELLLRSSEKLNTGSQAASGTHTTSRNARGTHLDVTATPALLEELRAGRGAVRMRIPVSESDVLDLELERFEVSSEATRFVIASDAGAIESEGPQVSLWRGKVAGVEASSVFLATADDRLVMGRIDSPGMAGLDISSATGAVAAGVGQVWTVRKADTPGATPDLVPPCGVTEAHRRTQAAGRVTAGVTVTHGPQIAVLAIEGDQSFTQLFPDIAAAQAYVVALVGAVSDIYERDLDVKLVLSSVRLWPGGGEPFGAADLGGFANYWLTNENTSGINLVHMLSGRRDLSYGGVAYVGGFCGGPTFGISGFLLGSFPAPVDDPDLGNWDVIVSAHEMGHNLGTFHTHDGYTPPIDECGSANIWAQGEIMSYCHSLQGGTLNIDMRFSSRIQDVIADEVAFEGCLVFDCNGNNIDDAQDILTAMSSDANGNSVPDECEDCNGNSVLDSIDISLGAADADGNGVPDSCEANCNANALPDEYETAFGFAPDANGNRVPDSCEPDCDGGLTPDFAEIAAAGSSSDIDRDGVPDVCQDCNGNGQPDWADLGRPGFVYVADQGSDTVRVYHARSGVLETTLGAGLLDDPYDLVFGRDEMLYVSSFANDRIVRIDPDTLLAAVVVVGAPMDGPAGLAFTPSDSLIIASQNNSQILITSLPSSGIFTVVPAGTGGLDGPGDIAIDFQARLQVGNANDSILAFNILNWGFLGQTVDPGEGGLTGLRQFFIDALPDVFEESIYAASGLADEVRAFSLDSGSNSRFNDEYPLTNPTGIARNLEGNVLVARAGVQPIRIIEYDARTGRYLRSFIRGDFDLTAPSSIAVRIRYETPPKSAIDCNVNGIPDECDLASGTSQDLNEEGTPDDCQIPSPWINNLIGVGTRSFEMSYIGTYGETGPTLEAIQVRIMDLQSPNPSNPPCCSPPNFSLFEQATCSAVGEAGGCARWLGPPATYYESAANHAIGSFRAARLQCSPYYHDWSQEGYFQVFGPEIMPSSRYEVLVYGEVCQGFEDFCTVVSPAVAPVLTRRAGDVARPFSPSLSTPQPDALDVVALVNKFRNLSGAPSKRVAQLQPNVVDPNVDISALDIVAVVDHFRGFAYSFSGPCPCPSAVMCDLTGCTLDAQCSGGLCVRTCGGGVNAGLSCRSDAHCPTNTCGAGFCRDRCGRCRD